jgi:cytochrome c oxidase subunit 3
MTNSTITTFNNQKHGFHLVDPSPWPLIAAFSAFMLTFGGAMYMHGYSGGAFLWRFGLLMILFMMYVWWRDIIREGTFEGQHTLQVQNGLKMGMLLFILSEVMFFFAFFWGFFHSSFNPSHALGGVWPPMGLVILDPWAVPLLNTIILLTSGATITVCHHSIVAGMKKQAMLSLEATIFLAIIFTALQAYEYLTAPFSISDGAYGSTFYMATGFHGFHVFIGTCFLTVCYFRIHFGHFTREHHFGFEAAAWYWHFVDVVWLFLFVTIYWWGS